MTVRPNAAARALDAAAVVLVGVGAWVFLAAHDGMKSLVAAQQHVSTIEAPNITRWVHFRTMSRIGLALAVSGIVVAVISYYRSQRRPVLTAATLPDFAPDPSPNVTPE